MKKVLITGAAGFVGSRLASLYHSQGAEVVCVDNFSDYYSVDLKKQRVAHFLTKQGIDLHVLDLSNQSDVEQMFGIAVPDVVIHLAAQAGVRLSLAETNKYVDANLVGFSNVLKSSIERQVPDFVYASSSSVYGNSLNVPYKETETGLSPVSFYGATKLSNELLAQALSLQTNTKIRGLRLFTVYGDYGRPDMACLRLVASLILGKDFCLFGDGSVRRDFTFVDDVAQSIVALVADLERRPQGYADVVNVGGGNPYTMNELIEIVNNLSIKKLNLVFDKPFHGDVQQTVADSSYLETLIGYAPKTPLSEGIKITYDWANQPEVSCNLAKWLT